MLHPGGCPHPDDRMVIQNDEVVCLGCGTVLTVDALEEEAGEEMEVEDTPLQLRGKCRVCGHHWILLPAMVKYLTEREIVLDCPPSDLKCPRCEEQMPRFPHFCSPFMLRVEDLHQNPSGVKVEDARA